MKRNSMSRIIIVLITLTLIAIPFTSKVRGKSPSNYEKVVVYPGDTLWSIAREITPSDRDIRKVIYEIRKLNKLESAIILPGQELLIPIN